MRDKTRIALYRRLGASILFALMCSASTSAFAEFFQYQPPDESSEVSSGPSLGSGGGHVLADSPYAANRQQELHSMGADESHPTHPSNIVMQVIPVSIPGSVPVQPAAAPVAQAGAPKLAIAQAAPVVQPPVAKPAAPVVVAHVVPPPAAKPVAAPAAVAQAPPPVHAKPALQQVLQNAAPSRPTPLPVGVPPQTTPLHAALLVPASLTLAPAVAAPAPTPLPSMAALSDDDAPLPASAPAKAPAARHVAHFTPAAASAAAPAPAPAQQVAQLPPPPSAPIPIPAPQMAQLTPAIPATPAAAPVAVKQVAQVAPAAAPAPATVRQVAQVTPTAATAQQFAQLAPAAGTPANAPLSIMPSELPPPPLANLPMPQPMSSSLPAPVSGQSRQILEGLPAEKTSSHHVKSPIKLDHEQANPLEAQTEIQKHDGVGISISVMRPKADISHMLDMAYDALVAGNQEDAIAMYKDVLSLQPDNKLALFGLATTYHRAGQIQLARPLYGRLLQLDPNNIEGMNNMLVLLGDESPQGALVELQHLEHSHPSFSPIPAQMSIIYEKMGNYQQAVEAMKRAITLSPENLKYRYDMAIILDKQGDWGDASVFYQQLITANDRGEKIPANAEEIQERLTFIRSNRPNT